MPEKKFKNDAYFGVCPTCGDSDGYLNIGRCHWMICHEHRVRWCVGSNLFSSWRAGSEDGWKQNWSRIGGYRDIGIDGSGRHRRAGAELRACRIQADRADLQMMHLYGGTPWKALGVRLRLADAMIADYVLGFLRGTGRPFCAFWGQRGDTSCPRQGENE